MHGKQVSISLPRQGQWMYAGFSLQISNSVLFQHHHETELTFECE